MIKIENVEVLGWEHAIRGMRNPMNSWEKSDSFYCTERVPVFSECEECPMNNGEIPHNTCTRNHEMTDFVIGPNDHTLMTNLAHGGPVHAKYRRMITVYLDITAPLYWWKEYDTYKVGTVANSCSTMHKIHEKEFTLEDFSTEHLMDGSHPYFLKNRDPLGRLKETIEEMNFWRLCYVDEQAALGSSIMYIHGRLATKKDYWYQLIQLLPTSYNQKRTVMLNYEVLHNIYDSRKHHKLDEWREFCKWIESLPYSEIITGGTDDET